MHLVRTREPYHAAKRLRQEYTLYIMLLLLAGTYVPEIVTYQ